MQGKTPFLDTKGLVFLTILAGAAILVPIFFLAIMRPVSVFGWKCFCR